MTNSRQVCSRLRERAIRSYAAPQGLGRVGSAALAEGGYGMQRKAGTGQSRIAAMTGPGALARRGLVAAKKAALRKPAAPAKVVRRMAKPRVTAAE